MEKKYQVFVSSTYEDLQEERKKVMEALLQMNCFPVGMEYFNASDSSQWEVIKSLIRECDYYVLIVAGRYGSIEEESGKSYTQKEFEYAIEQGVPVISFVHKKPESLPGTKIESEQIKRDKLDGFKVCVKRKLCKFWGNADELASQVVLSLTSLIKTNPRTGWVKADEISSAEANKELLKLKEENAKMNQQIDFLSSKVPVGIESYCQGEDKFIVKYINNLEDPSFDEEDVAYYYSYETTWNEVFRSICIPLREGLNSNKMRNLLNEYLLGEDCSMAKQSFDEICIQLSALKLIECQNGIYSLSSYGNNEMVRLMALKK